MAKSLHGLRKISEDPERGCPQLQRHGKNKTGRPSRDARFLEETIGSLRLRLADLEADEAADGDLVSQLLGNGILVLLNADF